MNEDNLRSEAVGQRPLTLLKRISWGAVFAGVIVTMVTQLTLSVLGVGLGASVLNVRDGDPDTAVKTGAAIWFLATTVISLFAGGYVAGWLAGMPRQEDRMLQGILTWGTSTLIMFLLITTAVGGLIGGLAGVMSRNLARPEAVGSAGPMTDRGSGQGFSEIRPNERLNLQQNNTGTDRDTQHKAASAARGVSRAAIWTFVILVLGAGAAACGGALGRPQFLIESSVNVPKAF